MARIRLEHLTKHFPLPKGGMVRALESLDLQVAQGEWVVLVGPSGSGKTTTLRLIAGLDEPTSGTVSLDDQPVHGLSARERNLAMVFQGGALYPHMTAYENIAFGLQVRNCPRNKLDDAVRSAAKTLGIQECLERRPMALSTGQRQRVALARALVRQPEAFLLDEPLANLDQQTRGQLRAELLNLRERLGTTAFYVTHDQHEAMTLGHRVGVMHEGILQQIGTAEQLYTQAANLFVARFLGWPPMNLLPGVITSARNDLGVEVQASSTDKCAFRFLLSHLKTSPVHQFLDRPVVLGIRSEDVKLNKSTQPVVTVEGGIRAIEHTGSDKYLHVELGSSELVARAPIDFAARIGEMVRLYVEPRKARLFDKETGKAIG